MRNAASLVGGVLIVTSLAAAGAAAATPAFVDRSAKLRSGPGPGYHILATLPRGTSVDVRGCRAGWCEIAWSGGRGYVGHNLLALAAIAPAVTVVPGAPYDDGYDYPGFDFPGIAYAPSFAIVNGPRWSYRRWSRWQQRPGAWRGPPQLGANPPRLERTTGRGPASAPAAGAESQFGARPTVGSTFSDSAVSAPRSNPAATIAPGATPLTAVPAASDPAGSSPAAERR